MRRHTLAIGIVSAIVSLVTIVGGPAAAQTDDDEPTGTIWDDHTLVVTAATPGTLSLTDTPGAPYDGPRIYCAWFSVVVTSTGVDIVGIADPTVGDTYVFNCWYTDPFADIYPGYPIVAVFDPVVDPPGPLITTPEVARFALDSIVFESPVAVTAPAVTHVVGVESWFAVDSELDYDAASAQAGPVWATVRPEFRHVTWDLGNGDRLVCTDDARTRWSTDGPDDQTSACTYAYRSSGEEAMAASATAHWTIWQQTDRTAGEWTVWGTVSLTTPLSIDVVELEAVINS
ncbi:MAG: hypothetical protein RIB98_14600 [Acidimicrobiales bacterium]